jgi:hypothetical protein
MSSVVCRTRTAGCWSGTRRSCRGRSTRRRPSSAAFGRSSAPSAAPPPRSPVTPLTHTCCAISSAVIAVVVHMHLQVHYCACVKHLCACANIATSLDECVFLCVFLRGQIVSMQVGCRPVRGRGPMSKALSSRRVFVQGSCGA